MGEEKVIKRPSKVLSKHEVIEPKLQPIQHQNNLKKQKLVTSLLLIGAVVLLSAISLTRRIGESQHYLPVVGSISKSNQPAMLDSLPNTKCPTSTALSIVAHQDDDILFQSPDLLHYIQMGWCVRTVYLTAGDASLTRQYWESRERGAEAAYSSMLGQAASLWITDTVKLSNRQIITVAHPKDNTRISLAFLRLPDGNIDGKGFKSTSRESLERLYSGKVAIAYSVDGQSQYDSHQLVTQLVSIMNSYNPKTILSQTPYDAGSGFHDHSDHIAAGKFTVKALKTYKAHPLLTVHYYTGYPIHGYPSNVFNQDLQAKKDAFYAYGKYDGAVCQDDAECNYLPVGAYLTRQYTSK